MKTTKDNEKDKERRRRKNTENKDEERRAKTKNEDEERRRRRRQKTEREDGREKSETKREKREKEEERERKRKQMQHCPSESAFPLARAAPLNGPFQKHTVSEIFEYNKRNVSRDPSCNRNTLREERRIEDDIHAKTGAKPKVEPQ